VKSEKIWNVRGRRPDDQNVLVGVRGRDVVEHLVKGGIEKAILKRRGGVGWCVKEGANDLSLLKKGIRLVRVKMGRKNRRKGKRRRPDPRFLRTRRSYQRIS